MSEIRRKRESAVSKIERYADKVLRTNLQWSDSNIKVQIPSTGQRSLVYFVEPAGSATVIVHAYPNRNDRDGLRRALELNQNLPIPRVIHPGGHLLEKWRFGYYFLTVEKVPGELLQGDIQGAVSQALAIALAQLHSVTSSTWGKPGEERTDSLWADLGKSIRRLLKSNSVLNSLGEDAHSISNWFENHLTPLKHPTEFQLCHHHLAPDDIVFDHSSNEIHFIDCADLQFSRASRDLAAIQNTLYRDRNADWEAFLNHYFNASPASVRTDAAIELPLFEAYYLLRKMRNALERESGTAQGMSHRLMQICRE